jgi:UPF0716 protein FxsA
MKFLLLFIGVPAIELALLIEVGAHIGTLNTFLLIIVTGILGANLARSQGLGVVRKVQAELARGEMPAQSLLDGAIILVAAALLLTPGVLTDLVGFFCLFPMTRPIMRGFVWGWVKRGIASGTVRVHSTGTVHPPGIGRPLRPTDPQEHGAVIEGEVVDD